MIIGQNQHFERMVETMPVGMMVTDPNTYITHVNPKCCELIGYDKSELIGKKLDTDMGLVKEDGSPLPLQEYPIIRSIRTMSPVQEVVGIRRAGTMQTIWLWVDTQLVKEDNGNLERIITTIIDITDRKQLEDQMRNEQNFFKTILGTMNGLVIVLDAEANIVGFNRACERSTGYLFEEVMGVKLWDKLILPEETEKVKQGFMGLREKQLPSEFENYWVTKDGSLRLIAWSNSVYQDPSGNIRYIIGTGIDITEKRRTEVTLKETESLYRNLVEDSFTGVFLFRQDGALQYYNPEFASVFGYTIEELRGKSIFHVIHPDDHELVRNKIERRISGELQSVRYHVRGRKKDQSVIELLAMGTVTVYNNEKLIVGSLMDITELKRMDDLLRQTDKLHLVGQLAAAIAHEIRNPLTTLRGFLQFMQPESKQKEFFELMLSELDRINEIVGEFLLLAKPQVSQIESRRLEELVQQVISLLQPEAIMKNIQILLNPVGELPLIPCEPNQIKQVFINLLKNAMESMPTGGKIVIDLQKKNDHHVVVRVKDQGVGVPKEHIARLGEPFYTTKEQGTGLGLMVTHKIIDNHRGSMLFDSESGKGTTIVIKLPIQDEGCV